MMEFNCNCNIKKFSYAHKGITVTDTYLLMKANEPETSYS